MKARIIDDYGSVLLTNKVTYLSQNFMATLATAKESNIPLFIIAVRVQLKEDRVYAILDGNHRAVAAALVKKPILVHEITCDADADEILQMELRGDVVSFPHREFLSGKKSFKELRHDAIRAVAKDMCFVSVADAAKDIVARQITTVIQAQRQLQELGE